MYGSSLMLVTRMPRDSRIAARDAAAMPLPREETTPPVTKTYLAIYLERVGMEESTRKTAAPQSLPPADRSFTTHSRLMNHSPTRIYQLGGGFLWMVMRLESTET